MSLSELGLALGCSAGGVTTAVRALLDSGCIARMPGVGRPRTRARYRLLVPVDQVPGLVATHRSRARELQRVADALARLTGE